jgi:hypothetical protein
MPKGPVNYVHICFEPKQTETQSVSHGAVIKRVHNFASVYSVVMLHLGVKR